MPATGLGGGNYSLGEQTKQSNESGAGKVSRREGNLGKVQGSEVMRQAAKREKECKQANFQGGKKEGRR